MIQFNLITLYTLHLLDKKLDLLDFASVSPWLTSYISLIWTNRYWDKNFISGIQMIEVLTTYLFFFLNRASECFRLTNLTITLLSCPLLFLESGSQWQPSIFFGSISTPESSQILVTVFSRSLSRMLFVMPDISTLFLWLYCFHFVWFFFQDKLSFSPI